jgi:hypothetical protein
MYYKFLECRESLGEIPFEKNGEGKRGGEGRGLYGNPAVYYEYITLVNFLIRRHFTFLSMIAYNAPIIL